MKRTLLLLTVFIACGCGSSLRYRNDVNKDISAGNYPAAQSKIEARKKTLYKEKDSLLYYLDLGLVEHEAHKPKESDLNFAAAQERIDELFTKSVTRQLGRVVINEMTAPYPGQIYERSLTYFYRALNFLDIGDLSGALVEARKAVFYLDNLRGEKPNGYNDDPFVQYFASLLFESGGNLSSARIARTNAVNAYEKSGVPAPRFDVPKNADKMGEIIFFHYNGHVPLLTSRTMQVAWSDAMLSISGTDEMTNADPRVQNAVIAGFMGNAVTIAYPVLTPYPYFISGSSIQIGDRVQNTVLAHDISALVLRDFEERKPGIMARMIVRAVTKQLLARTAGKAVESGSKDQNLGTLAGMVFSAVNAATETADTRMWFTLPGEIRMTRVFVRPGRYKTLFRAYDAGGSVLENKDLEDIEIKAGERRFLHHRTGK